MTDERTEAQLRASAELVVDTRFEVKEGDVVTIITDDRRKPEAEMVANVVAERGGLPVVAPVQLAGGSWSVFKPTGRREPRGELPGRQCP